MTTTTARTAVAHVHPRKIQSSALSRPVAAPMPGSSSATSSNTGSLELWGRNGARVCRCRGIERALDARNVDARLGELCHLEQIPEALRPAQGVGALE